MVSYDVLGPGGRATCMLKLLSCRAASKGLFPVGKLTQSGAEVKFGSKGSWIDLHTDGEMQRVLVRVKGQTFWLLDPENQCLDHT